MVAAPGVSADVQLPERVDVLVSDLHGVLPYLHGLVASIIDARDRFLVPGGVLVPRSESLWVACVEAPELHRRVTSPWSDNRYGLDMDAARTLAANRWSRAVFDPAKLVSAAHRCGELDYATVSSPDFDAVVTLEAARNATTHGLCVWFDSLLAEGIEFSNAPGSRDLVYGNAYFPWPVSVSLEAGDHVELRLRARPVAGEYLWTWDSRVVRGTEELARFRQSDFFSEPLDPALVRRHSEAHVPRLGEDGQIDGLILELMGRSVSLGEIAREIASRYPRRFPLWRDALSRVAELSVRYSRAT